MTRLATILADTTAGPLEVRLEAELVELRESSSKGRTLRARLYTIGERTRDWRRLAFRAGALASAIAAGETLPLAYAHNTGGGLLGGRPDIVGAVRNVRETKGEAWADLELAAGTESADEVWQLIEQGALSKVSIGGRIVRYEFDEESEELDVLEFDLMEVSIVPVPAMRSASITRNDGNRELVRLARQGASMDDETTLEPTTTPAPAATSSPATTLLEERLAALEDTVRAQAAPANLPTTGSARPTAPFASFGDVLSHVAMMDRGAAAGVSAQAAAATDRLAPYLEAGAITTGPKGMRVVDVFAFEVGDTGDFGPTTSADSILRLLRQGRVTSSFFARGNLDEVPGVAVNSRIVSQGSLVGYQTEGGDVPSQKVTLDEDTFPKFTAAGGQTITVQARDWSRPGYMSEVLEDLAADYGEFINGEVVAGTGDAGPPATAEGILTVQTNREDATNAVVAKGLVAAIGTSKGNVFTGSRRWPRYAFANGDTLGMIDGWTDSDGRPLLATDGMGVNPIGESDGPSPAGKLRGMLVYAEDAMPDDELLIASFRDAKLWESASAPIQVGLTYPSILTIDVAVFGYFAVAIRRAGSFDVVENIGATA